MVDANRVKGIRVQRNLKSLRFTLHLAYVFNDGQGKSRTSFLFHFLALTYFPALQGPERRLRRGRWVGRRLSLESFESLEFRRGGTRRAITIRFALVR